VALVAGTINFRHVPYGKSCAPAANSATGGRSIIVGS
jgi:predicted branched-subunit amino acid permease